MVEKPPPSPPVPDTYKIVVGIDYEKPSELALSTALSTALYRDGQVYAITVAEGDMPSRPEELSEELHKKFLEEAQATLERYLSEQIAEYEKSGFKINRKRVGAAVDFGKPADAILELAREVEADLIVVGTHGKRGLERLLVGSVAEEVLKGAHCPVLVLRDKP
ncbi:MAG: universal stress protein [Myxococcales bacterium]|nr:universal stress protein [Myxococcales bacterium]MCB9575926.1 universal stress protein [Polyangiaceae bacterium]